MKFEALLLLFFLRAIEVGVRPERPLTFVPLPPVQQEVQVSCDCACDCAQGGPTGLWVSGLALAASGWVWRLISYCTGWFRRNEPAPSPRRRGRGSYLRSNRVIASLCFTQMIPCGMRGWFYGLQRKDRAPASCGGL